jgi:hypothetical protein
MVTMAIMEDMGILGLLGMGTMDMGTVTAMGWGLSTGAHSTAGLRRIMVVAMEVTLKAAGMRAPLVGAALGADHAHRRLMADLMVAVQMHLVQEAALLVVIQIEG